LLTGEFSLQIYYTNSAVPGTNTDLFGGTSAGAGENSNVGSTLFFATAKGATRQEEEMRSLQTQVLYMGDHESSGIVARGGHKRSANIANF
jgi:hypothetical protein